MTYTSTIISNASAVYEIHEIPSNAVCRVHTIEYGNVECVSTDDWRVKNGLFQRRFVGVDQNGWPVNIWLSQADKKCLGLLH